MLNGASYILNELLKLDVRYIFGIPGAHIDPLLINSLESKLQTIICCHELSAGYMADGYSRASNNLGVVFTIGGPGSNNTVTAINTARIEKSPLLLISGDVPQNMTHVPGFQCGNGLGARDDKIFQAITKFSRRVKFIEELEGLLNQAITNALTPPFGPSHLIIPYNIFNEKWNFKPIGFNKTNLKYQKYNHSSKTINKIKKLLLSNKKIVLWIGDSLNKKEESNFIINLAEKFQIPVATTYASKGVIPEGHYLSVGNMGYAGSSLAYNIFNGNEPDTILGFDIDQNERNTVNWSTQLYKNKDLIFVNFPGGFINESYGEFIEDNPYFILRSLHELLKGHKYNFKIRKEWLDTINKRRTDYNLNVKSSEKGFIEPGRIVNLLRDEMPKETILFVDSGNHRVFPGFYWKAYKSESFYSASVTAPLGWAISAAIGSTFSRKEPTVVLTGDGCMQMHGIELKTAVKHNIPLLVIISNNSAFGNIYSRFSKISDEAAELSYIKEINWCLFGKSMGIETYDINNEQEFVKQIRVFLENKRLTILNVRTPLKPYIPNLNLVKSAFA